MRIRLLPLLCASVFLAAATVSAHDEDGSANAAGKLGTVHFPSSCAPAMQPAVEHAVALLHSFVYPVAEREFAEIFAKDPTCAIATWGYASILMSNPLAGIGPTADNAKKAQAMLAKGRAAGAKTERERDYIEAVGAYYDGWDTRPEKERQILRSKAYQALAAKYPDDDEAQIFNALYLAGTQSQADQTYAAYLKAAAVLEEQWKKHPDHPGVAHYLIHSYDAPPIAEKGLKAARQYADIAPAAPHALHMPSHIFTRVGAWEESAATNARSFKAAVAGGEPGEAYHASDYAVYALLQLGRDGDAKRVMDNALRVEGIATNGAYAYGASAMPARYALERGDWKAATQLQVVPSKVAFAEANTYFARALGAVRSGDLARAETEAGNLATLHKALEDAKNRYWATEVEVQRLAIAGWIAHRKGNAEEGAKLMRAAADLEDRNEKHIVTPGRMVPARELLGDMLLEQNQAAAALKEYEMSRAREPNRFRNYYGSMIAARAMGDDAKAREFAGRLVNLTEKGDGARPEIANARMMSGQR